LNKTWTQKEIDQPTIMILVELLSQVVGEATVQMALNSLIEKGGSAGSELIMDLSEEIELLFGSDGAYAILRQVGRQFAEIASKGKNANAYEVSSAINALGIAREVELTPEHACVMNCVFHKQIINRDREAVDHPVCWIDRGVLEGYLNNSDGSQQIHWSSRDNKQGSCNFERQCIEAQ